MVMNRNYLPVLIIALMLFAGCASVPTKDIQVDVQSDLKANFSGYKTYTWLAAAAIVNDPYGQWEPPQFDADAEIMFLIDRELRKRGMSENTAGPDLKEFLENVPQGGLVVVLVDSRSGFVIWIGVATAELQESPDTQTVKARLDHAVTQMFNEFPK